MVLDFPLTIPIEVSRGVVVELDRWNDEKIVQSPFETVMVFAWTVNPVEEKSGESTLRVIDQLEVILPPEDAPPPSGQFRTPDGDVWQVDGSPSDPNNNPWWKPGLVTVKARRVDG